MHSFEDWRRLLGLQSIGPFTPIWLTRNGLVTRLLQAGLVPLQDVWDGVSAQLALTPSKAVPAQLAAFAPEILCLAETRLDASCQVSQALAWLKHTGPSLLCRQIDWSF